MYSWTNKWNELGSLWQCKKLSMNVCGYLELGREWKRKNKKEKSGLPSIMCWLHFVRVS